MLNIPPTLPPLPHFNYGQLANSPVLVCVCVGGCIRTLNYIKSTGLCFVCCIRDWQPWMHTYIIPLCLCAGFMGGVFQTPPQLYKPLRSRWRIQFQCQLVALFKRSSEDGDQDSVKAAQVFFSFIMYVRVYHLLNQMSSLSSEVNRQMSLKCVCVRACRCVCNGVPITLTV